MKTKKIKVQCVVDFEAIIATDLDDPVKPDNRLNVIREGLFYLNRIGAPKSIEPLYAYSINGIPLGSIAILTDYEGASRIKDSFTTAFIDMNNASSRTYNGIVGLVDTVPVFITNQLGTKVGYHIMSKGRVIVRDLDPNVQYLGVVTQGNGMAVKLRDGTTVNVKPSEFVVALEQGRAMGVKYFEEFITIEVSA